MLAVQRAVMSIRSAILTVVLALSAAWIPPVVAQTFDVVETPILALAEAQSEGRVTARQLVEAYLERIAAYDWAGPQLHSLVTLNMHALEEADRLDRERKAGKVRGPLHGIPIVVKDNFDTADMPTSGGTLALATFQTEDDAFQVRRLRQAGAIILGKTAMHELALGDTTVSSLSGVTRNPYDLARVPGGSSGGTAAAVAASFAAAGLGTDTCGSIRTPAAFQNLYGLRPTHGLSSRAGIIPLAPTQDAAGPLTRSVTDLALLLDATVGADPADPITAAARGHIPRSYRDALKMDGLQGARIGVLRTLFGAQPEDAEVARALEQTLTAMKSAGANVLDVNVPGLTELLNGSSVIGYEFKESFAAYLASHPRAPVNSIAEIFGRGLDYEDAGFRALMVEFNSNATGEGRAFGQIFNHLPATRDAIDEQAYREALVRRRALRSVIMAVLEANRLDALAYPVTQRPAQPVGAGSFTPGLLTCGLSAQSGLPALAVPAGFTDDGLPIGLDLLGNEFEEPRLLRLAFAWEQVAKLRRAPFSTPRLESGVAPLPLVFDTRLESGTTKVIATFTYDRVRSELQVTAAAEVDPADRIIALTLQRGDADKPGPIIGHILQGGATQTTTIITLEARDRTELMAGRIFLHLYSSAAPFGVGRSVLDVSRSGSSRQSNRQ